MATLSETFQGIADAIRAKAGSTEKMKPADMPTNIENIPSGGSDEVMIDLIERDITSLTIPTDVTSIREYAFAGCSDCTTYDFKSFSSIPTLNSTNAFTNISSDAIIYVPMSLYDDWVVASNWSSYKPHIQYEGMYLVIEDGTTSIADSEYEGNVAMYITIPTTITSIGANAFKDCSRITTYDFSEYTSIPTLGAGAFDGCADDMKIKVPKDLYDDWVASENWNDYADHITYEYDKTVLPLTFEARTAGSTVYMTQESGGPTIDLVYSLDGGTTWNDFTVGTTTITLENVGDTVMFKARTTNSAFGVRHSGSDIFLGVGSLDVYGNANYLLNGNDPDSITTVENYALNGVFRGNTAIVDASNLYFPATTLKTWAYGHMFEGCSSLVNGPMMNFNYVDINYCLEYLFYNCPNLTNFKITSSGAISFELKAYSIQHWLEGVASEGTVYYNGSTTSLNLPSNWSISTYEE